MILNPIYNFQIVRRRNRNNRGILSSSAPPPQQRPLTRYMPVSMQNENFDLRAHIESAGHQVTREKMRLIQKLDHQIREKYVMYFDNRLL